MPARELKENDVKKAFVYGGLAALSLGLVFSTGCEWTGGGGTSSYNTSQGAGVNLNFSGVYNGTFGGGKAVANSSGAAITRFVLTQSGNAVEVLDNNGNRYKGNVGSPGLAFTPSTDATVASVIPAGAQVMEGQITFAGRDGSSGKDVEFVGVIHAVAVSDIKGTTKVDRQGSTNAQSSTSSSSQNQQTTVTKTFDDGTNTTTTSTVTIGNPTDPFYNQIVTTVVYDNTTGAQLSKTVTQTGSSQSSQGDSSSSGTTTTTTYQITEANTQYRLEGTWLEKGGKSSDVDALSPATSGLVTQTATTGG